MRIRGAIWNRGLLLLAAAGAAAALTGLRAAALADPGRPEMHAAPPVDFDRDVRPILSENCFACHGFDEKTRMAGLRLDTREGALHRLRSGKAAIVPGRPEESELIRRVAAGNALRMPPASTGKQLTPRQIETLRAWIRQGAPYEPHWAFVPPKRPPLPRVRDRRWPRNPIDVFVLARLEKEGLRPSPTADRYTLLRRVTLDLTGLPPTPAEVRAFVADRSPDAWEKVVDRLLASPHYGERMALKWLDLARYADTHGYHIDSHRDMWLWRDWVIRAFNENMPFDRFTIEQLAGDLLPNPTRDQIIATGFNRNHPINFEGGAIPEEYHTAYVVDRVDTTATTWMALTAKCAQCHDHKYDPMTQREFYRLYAYFNNIAEKGLDGQRGNAEPYLRVPSPEQERQLAAYDAEIARLERELKERERVALAELERWAASADPARLDPPELAAGLVVHFGLDEREGTVLGEMAGRVGEAVLRGPAARAAGVFGGALQLDGAAWAELPEPEGWDPLAFDRADAFSYGAWVYPASGEALTVLSRMEDAAAHRGWDLYLSGGRAYVHLIHAWESNAIRVHTKAALPLNAWSHLFVTYDGSGRAKGVRVYIDGKPAEVEVTHDSLTGTIRAATPLRIGRRNPGAPFRGRIDEVRLYRRALSPQEVAQLAALDPARQALAASKGPGGRRSTEQEAALRRYYLDFRDPLYPQLAGRLAEARRLRSELEAAVPTTMVMKELEQPRETFVLIRGEYDKKGEKVTPGVPAFLPPLPKDAPPNRLALARWLVSPEHPLTARVAVNRFWALFFGNGLVRTPENFGLQSERPTHPELLDWLAVEFRESGWDVKRMLRLIVTSNTYKQTSRASAALIQRDPDNLLLARGPRFRLPAEFIRDQALAVSGLLVRKLGGPSVKPYQPPGLWEEISFGGNFTAQTYEQDHGEKLYRRSLYTFWKRTAPPPALQTFDAPEREFCVVRRSVSNTPLQALVLMNDPTYVEAARHFAARLMTEVAATPDDRIRYACMLALARPATEAEVRVLRRVFLEQREHYRRRPEEARKLLSVGESPRDERLDPIEHAAWTSVASVLFNTDEMITKN